MSKILPPLVLFLLAPVIAELLSGSAPPAEFFHPTGFWILSILYGGGAILVRELKIRWRQGWLSLLLMGAAYAIIEEVLMVKSFFDPAWMDLGILGSYGRWLEVNWVWSVELTIYHAVVSIAIPIGLTELLFPERRDEPWVSRGVRTTILIFFIADIVVGNMILTRYQPSIIHYIVTTAIVAGLVILAWRLPRSQVKPGPSTAGRPFWFWLTGFLGTVAFFIIFAALPQTSLPPVVTIMLSIGLVLVVTGLVRRLSGNGMAWDDRQRLALAAGPLTVFILLSPIQEFVADRPDNPAGMTLVGLAVLVFVLFLWRRIRMRSGHNE